MVRVLGRRVASRRKREQFRNAEGGKRNRNKEEKKKRLWADG